MKQLLMERLMILGIVLLTGLLGLLFGRRKSKYPEMAQCFENPFLHFFLYALAIFILAFAAFIAFIVASDESAWEQASKGIIEVFSLFLLIIVSLVALAVKTGKHYIYYNQEKIILGRVFGGDFTLSWCEISEVRANRNGQRIRIYNREGKKVLDAGSRMADFNQFYHIVMQNCGNRVVYE